MITTQKEAQSIGLSQAEADRLLHESGQNCLEKQKKKSTIKIFAGQFHDVMVMILIIAAVISVLIGGWQDAIPIVIIVVMNAALGFFQEYRCEKTLEQMERLAAPTAHVYRDGRLVTIPSQEVVIGDVFEISAGERFPCDCVILTQAALSCDESFLTGESEAVTKTAFKGENEKSKLSLPYIGYMGCVVLKGRARCEAIATGTNTQMGRVSSLLADIEDEQTPLQQKLGELGRILSLICIGVCVLVFVAGLIRGEQVLNMFFTSVTIAIAAIPEGLPAAVTIALALAVRRMLKQNALVRRLHSVETLGCANVICTDKTGTLTKNEMKVQNLCVLNDEILDFTYPDDGVEGLASARGSDRYMAWENSTLSEALLCAALCNNVTISSEIPTTKERNRARPKPMYEGNPTEIALVKVCKSCGIDKQNLLFERVDEKPFDSESKLMSVTCRDREGRLIAFTKGAPEVVISNCTHRFSKSGLVKLEDNLRAELLAKNEGFANEGLRVIALSEASEGCSVFLGLAALSDPLRDNAAQAVRECKRAGINTVMITGDHKLTACAIARQAGILTASKRVCTGSQLDKMSDEQLADEIDDIAVFARVTPAHKLKIVRAYKAKGKICAMTGDGVNDAPAIKEASIGVSMGISGTEVTKQAADMILLDDNFSTLVTAVKEGRTIYANIRKFVRYLIACNIGEVLTMLGAIVMGLPLVLVPAQLLLVNLVTDGLPAAALSVEPTEKGVMSKPPRGENDSFFSDGLMTKIIMRGILISICTLASFTLLLTNGCSLDHARTGAMLTLVFSQLIHAFECRSENKTLFEISLKGSAWVLASVILSAICVVVCIMIPSLASIFSLAQLNFKSLAISSITALAVPLGSGILGKLKKAFRRTDSVTI
ncbi:MAG: cation-translocating P-type ATPase [Ruminococcus sp.]|nr:cation-translocating P-type ATPase [Ruminococcus sp.]